MGGDEFGAGRSGDLEEAGGAGGAVGGGEGVGAGEANLYL